ncbi:MAG: DUF2075 domain-containing protein [Lachnospiraceae bacterium]|nr:DUF2075 domain-containing protein [Lachnospiraceae bacterium]
MIIQKYPFDKSGKEAVEGHPKGSDWPVIYLISNDKYLYIGETTSASKRMNQHLTNKKKQSYEFNSIRIVFDDEYNKSVILDYEQKLIKCCSTDKKYTVVNANAGQSETHDYYQRSEYLNKFSFLWQGLRDEGIANKPLDVIENEDIFKYSPYNSLTAEQNEISVQIINDFCDMLEKDDLCGRISLVNGCAGTGKTVLAISIINSLINAQKIDPDDLTEEDLSKDKVKALLRLKAYLDSSKGHPLKIGFVFPMSGIRKTIKRVFKESGNGLKANMVISPYDLKKDEFDILFVDESHRLFCRKNLGNAFKNFDTTCEVLGLDPHTSSQLDWVFKRGRYNVLFYDKDQSIRSSDIPHDVYFKKLTEAGKVCNEYSLSTQMRCAGGDTYVHYVKEIINCKQQKFEDIANYDFTLFDDADTMITKIRTLDREQGLCRTVAGYAWEWKTKMEKSPQNNLEAYYSLMHDGKYDISIQGHNYIWNLTTEDWISREDSPLTIGCIHTTQGFDLNYVGVIFGREIDYDPVNNCLTVDLSKYYDKAVKAGCSEETVKNYIINTYTTFMARGIKGCYVYAYNSNLQKYLERFIRKK